MNDCVLGQSDIKQLSDRLASLRESERKYVCYHSECRKPIVNMSMIARLRSKRVMSDSPVCLAQSPGRSINTTDSAWPNRTTSSQGVCVLSSCSFCPNDTAGSLHRAFSDGIGESLIEIKLKTQDDHVRTCVSELEGAGDGYVSCLHVNLQPIKKCSFSAYSPDAPLNRPAPRHPLQSP